MALEGIANKEVARGGLFRLKRAVLSHLNLI